ncbi:MAG: hypothetical protein IT435_14935 [Phycisphaerales bacterium]|nr:hypothetical protein [Phycisphaerales bacterium]
MDPSATAAARAGAAQLLLIRALADQAGRTPITQALNGPISESSPAWFILGAMEKTSNLPDWLLPTLTAALDRADERAAPRIINAMAGIRTRESARSLLAITASTRPEALRRDAWTALARLTGRKDLADNAAAWQAWLDECDLLSHQEWADRLAQGLAQRSDAAEADRQQAMIRLVESYRRLHVGLPPEHRSEFLAGLLRDDVQEVRSLGFELVSRELSENARLGPEVSAAAISLITSAKPSVRERAALLITQISPENAQIAVKRALAAETDPRAASALLQAAARWPDPDMFPTALSWVAPDGAATASAVDYIRTLVRAGFLQSEDERQRVLNALRPLLPDKAPPGACDLLINLGEDDDIRSVAQLLSSPNAAVRQAAAQSLLIVPDHVDDILLAAAQDPELFEIAVRAVAMYWPTADGFKSISSIRAPSQDARRRGLLKVAQMLPSPDLVSVSTTAEPGLREPLLSNLASINRILSERHSTATFEALGEGLLMLAQIRLELNKPDGALAALDAMPELAVLEGEAPVDAVRTESLLCLGRLSEAANIRSSSEPWIAALARSLDKPFSRQIADEIERRFGTQLSPADQLRFQNLRRRLPPTNPATPENDEGSPTDPR